jgi:signal transduction histidine kinase
MADHVVYLGDGVYAHYRYGDIILAANDPCNEVITLEPEVMKRLVDWVNEMRKPKEKSDG